jgi:hypothetical protein
VDRIKAKVLMHQPLHRLMMQVCANVYARQVQQQRRQPDDQLVAPHDSLQEGNFAYACTRPLGRPCYDCSS